MQEQPPVEAEFKRIKIPLVRRIYPSLIANKIVSVQPLLGPSSLVYYLRYRYSSNKGTRRADRWKVQKRWKYENKAGRLASRRGMESSEPVELRKAA